MIKSVTVENSKRESLVIDLVKPLSSGFAITDISGLGPVKATINTTKYATRDGSLFSSARVDERNIVLSMVFVAGEGESIEDVRQRSYQYFSVKDNITLTIKTDNRNCEIKGYVESNDPDIFSQRESTQISIICPDPYFYDYSASQRISFVEVERLFHLPVYNDGLAQSTIKMGTIVHQRSKAFVYNGDGRCGFWMQITIKERPGGKITITNKATDQKMIIDTSLMPDNVKSVLKVIIIRLNTIPGDKYVRYSYGSDKDFLYGVASGSDWLEVVPGENTVEIDYDGDNDTIEAWMRTPVRYEGI